MLNELQVFAEHGNIASEESANIDGVALPPGLPPVPMVYRGPGGAPVIRLPPGVMRPPGMPGMLPPGPPPGLPPAMRMHRLPTGNR